MFTRTPHEKLDICEGVEELGRPSTQHFVSVCLSVHKPLWRPEEDINRASMSSPIDFCLFVMRESLIELEAWHMSWLAGQELPGSARLWLPWLGYGHVQPALAFFVDVGDSEPSPLASTASILTNGAISSVPNKALLSMQIYHGGFCGEYAPKWLQRQKENLCIL